MKNNKGQIFTTDLITALTVFLFILMISTASTGLTENSLNQEEKYFEMQEKALNASSVLILTKGEPENWTSLETSQINSIGLAEERNTINKNKINDLIENRNYNEIKEILGLQKYDFYFKITELNGQTIKEFGTAPENEKKTIVIERYILFEKTERKFLLEVFE